MKKLVGILVTSLALGGTAVGTGAAIQNHNQATENAMKEAGVAAESTYDVESELDYENGKPVYEVEFESNGYEYDYNVDAETGAVVQTEKAKAIALEYAGVSEDQVVWEEVEHDYDDGRLEYQIEFRVGNKEYDYEVDAKTGKITERDIDVDDDLDDYFDDDKYDDDWDDIWDD